MFRCCCFYGAIPGAGKTYLAPTVIDSLQGSTSEKLGYFHCHRAEENCRQPESILNTLIHQFVPTEKNQLSTPIVDIYHKREQQGQTSSRLSFMESLELLVQLTDIHPQATICIDALDEVEYGIPLQLLTSLKHVVERSKNLVKIFATTGMDTDIVRQFEMFPRIDLQPDDNVTDIKRFVESKVQSIIDDRLLLDGKVDSERKAEIREVFCKRSKGIFQLAALDITEFFCDMVTPRDVRRSLTSLPTTLTEAYGEIYKRILSQKGSAARLALNEF
ncbi:hypothetical protein BZA05DRAFT_210352 [Tricharina praecox]|uniref:uncharacterized protein n=1 Tax=Tricharina praecox TaxID=43433 RepID=UPI00221FA92E|nr:uncharacterized protein BZA05DRAFT_210352 [Tricharina praecox]KAI5841667.1 hypothetical protein BZA05DRAFT_210352 [Tricharina praecox]